MRVRTNFLYGLAGPLVIIAQVILSGVRGYSNELKCVFWEITVCFWDSYCTYLSATG